MAAGTPDRRPTRRRATVDPRQIGRPGRRTRPLAQSRAGGDRRHDRGPAGLRRAVRRDRRAAGRRPRFLRTGGSGGRRRGCPAGPARPGSALRRREATSGARRVLRPGRARAGRVRAVTEGRQGRTRTSGRRPARRVPGHVSRADEAPVDAVRRPPRHGGRRSAPVHLRLARGERREPGAVLPGLRAGGRRDAVQPVDELAERPPDPRGGQRPRPSPPAAGAGGCAAARPRPRAEAGSGRGVALGRCQRDEYR